MNSLSFDQKVKHNIQRGPKLADHLAFRGSWKMDHLRNGLVIAQYDFLNDVVNVGKNMILNVMFNGATASTTWYIGIINNAGFSALSATDTMSSHSGWAEFTGYSQSNRVTWASGSATAQSITNSSPAQFDINTSSATLYGIFITDNNTKGGTSGNLWSTAAFSSTVPVVNGDQLKVTYTLNC